jgi:hypothetical protein
MWDQLQGAVGSALLFMAVVFTIAALSTGNKVFIILAVVSWVLGIFAAIDRPRP